MRIDLKVRTDCRNSSGPAIRPVATCLILLTLLSLSGCGSGGGNAKMGDISPRPSQSDGLLGSAEPNQILFTAIRDKTQPDHNFEIYAVNGDGSGLQRITATTADDADPSWSADHSQIAFVRSRRRHLEIKERDLLIDPSDPQDLYITGRNGLAEDGGEAKPRFRVPDSGGTIARPRFSPDGKMIYFLYVHALESDNTTFVAQIVRLPVDAPVTNADKEKPTVIVAKEAASGVALSPDGARIVYSKRSGDTYTLFLAQTPVVKIPDTDIDSLPARAITTTTINGKTILGATGGDFDPAFSQNYTSPTVYFRRSLSGSDSSFNPVHVQGIFRVHLDDSSSVVEQMTSEADGDISLEPNGSLLTFTRNGHLVVADRNDLSNSQNVRILTDIEVNGNSQITGNTSW